MHIPSAERQRDDLSRRERGGNGEMKQARRFVNVTAIDTAVFRLKL